MFAPINLKGTQFELTDELRDLCEKKVAMLEKLLPEGETDIVCDAELERMTGQQSGKIYRAEINLRVGGKLFRAEATEERMEDAIERAKEELERELQKAKGRNQSLFRRGARKVKDLFRFGR